MRIAIDCGHTLKNADTGAQGCLGREEDRTREIGALVMNKLKALNHTVINCTVDNANSVTESLQARVNKANSNKADIFVSIHLNKYPSGIYSGWQTFYQEGNDESIMLATCIQEGLNNSISTPNNRVPLPLKGIYIMDNVENTTVTVECGFLSNEVEAKRLEEDAYQDKLAWGIYIGIQDFFYSEK